MATGTNELKLKLRQEMLDIRNAMSVAECTAASIAICNKLWEAYRRFKYDKTGVFLSYYHMKNEVHLTNMHENLLKNGYELFFPVIEDEELSFYFAQSPSDFSKGRFGIMVPRERNLPFDESEDAICFVPGVAFSQNGERLGLGKGYYDRFFMSHPNIKRVGICYERQIKDDLPVSEYDIPMNYIVTEKRIIEIQA